MVAKKAGADPPELRNLPILCSYSYRLWALFLQVRQGIPQGFSGPNPMSHENIRAFVLNTGKRINKREISILQVLDYTYIKEIVNV